MKQCKNCRTVNDDNFNFCKKCGSAALEQIDDKNAKKKKIKKTVLICIGVFIGINILLFAIAMFAPSSGDTTSNSDSSSKSKWINYGSEIIDGSGIYYYYDEKPQNFVDDINKVFSEIANDKNVDISKYGETAKYTITDTTDNPNDVTTYTCSFGTANIYAYYLDCNDDGILQIRTALSIDNLVNAGITDVNAAYSYSATNITTALVACNGVDKNKVDDMYSDLYKNLKNGKNNFYINGFAVLGKLDSSTRLQQYTIIKIDKDKYDSLLGTESNTVELEY